MKLSEIKTLKDFGKYHFDLELKSLPRWIEEHQREYGLQLRPDFQRGDRWSLAQQIAFVEFLLKGGKTQPILLNHPLWTKGLDAPFVCVDGLQRLTALLKFLEGKLPVFGGHYAADIEDLNNVLRQCHLRIYINELKTEAEVLEWYLELNSGGTPHTAEELDKVRVMLSELQEEKIAEAAA